MIQGVVSPDGVPTIQVQVANQEWAATIDTGFNGDLELPEALRTSLNIRDTFGLVKFALAGGQTIEEYVYIVDFPFDGRLVEAAVTFVSDNQILIGTRLLQDYWLQINFVTRTVALERVAAVS
ncbi:hypothetical protein C6495_05745 [Candidatus Poribacteria bacterium]|nr:MAG: hypothetical protein C6495_05745 [Candidatus Poribacteria bacterium]